MPYKTFKETMEEVKRNDTYGWAPGAPDSEHLPEDQHQMEVQKMQDEINALKDHLAFYEDSEAGEIIGLRNLTEQYKEQIAEYEEQIAEYKENLDRCTGLIEDQIKEIENLNGIVKRLRVNAKRLKQQLIIVKAENYDLCKEKRELVTDYLRKLSQKEKGETT